MTTSAAVLYVAQREVGFRASPGNDTPYSAWYQQTYPLAGNDFDGENWCGMFLSWVWHQAGFGLQFAWVPSGVSAFKFYGLFDGVPRPGDAVFYDWDANGQADHVGLVEAVHFDGTVQTIEGNTGSPVGVYRGLIGPSGDRAFTDVLGYGHPAYALA